MSENEKAIEILGNITETMTALASGLTHLSSAAASMRDALKALKENLDDANNPD